MLSLQAIGERVGTDKATVHSYLPIYEKLLGHLRQEPITLLEIGAGWSLFMWLEYFERGQIGVMDKDYPKGLRPDPRLTFYTVRQEDEAELNRFRELRFDIIIDDGSHRSVDQLMTCHALWQCLKPGGFYFIEDVPQVDRLPYWSMMPGYQAWTPLKADRCDDILVLMRKAK